MTFFYNHRRSEVTFSVMMVPAYQESVTDDPSWRAGAGIIYDEERPDTSSGRNSLERNVLRANRPRLAPSK